MKSVLTVLIFCTFFSCNSPNDSSSDDYFPNHPPVIEDIVVFPGTRGISYSFDLICVAHDEDEDSLTYVWDSRGGHYVDFHNNMAHWAGDSVGTYEVICTISDGEENDEFTITIHVTKEHI